MIKTAIVEDEVVCAEELKSYLERFGNNDGGAVSFSIKIFNNGDAFLKNYTSDYDLVFMDIEMPGINGMDAAKYLRERDSEVMIVFVTNMRQYALQGYTVAARDYILKPLKYSEFEYHMKRLMPQIKANEGNDIVLSFMEEKVRLSVRDIFYVEVSGHNLIYHTARGDYKTKDSLTSAEKQLPDNSFARCNSGYLVNLEHIREIKGSDVNVAGTFLQISRPKKKEFINRFTVYIGERI